MINIKGIACVCGVSLFHFTLGTVLTFGNISPYISSYLKFRTSDIWVTTGHTVWIFASKSVVVSGCMILGGLTNYFLSTRYVCLIAGFTMSFNVILTYFSIKSGLAAVTVTYGVCLAIGLGFGHSVSLSAAIKWFPEYPGLISGLVSGAFGFGAFMFTIVQSKYINPWNVSPIYLQVSSNTTKYIKEKYFLDDQVLDRIPTCFIVLGILYFTLQVIAVIAISDNEPENIKEIKESSNDEETLLHQAAPNVSQNCETTIDLSIMEILKTKTMWLLFFTYFFNGFYIIVVAVHYKAFGQEFIDDDNYFTWVGAICGFFNSLSRIIWGHLFDILGYRIVMSVLTIIMAVALGTFYFCSFITNQGAVKAVFMIWICVLFIGLGGHSAIMPSVAAKSFGSRNFATIYGVLFIAPGVLGTLVSCYFFNVMKHSGQFYLSATGAIISLILSQFYRSPELVVTKESKH